TGGAINRSFGYAASGQLTSDTKNATAFSYLYNGAGRMVEAQNGGVPFASYAYDAFGQRVSKATTAAAPGGASSVHFIHDEYGRLIAEHNGATGAPLREYVWLGLQPVAYIDHSSGIPVTYYVHPDQVMNPQKLTNAAGAVVWDRVYEPFGDEISVSGALTEPLRFPGQTADAETQFFQNWNRDYDPSLGRYIQSDPIGLIGGINTYAYVEGNPLSHVDPTGEFVPLLVGVAIGVGLEYLTNPCATTSDLLLAGAIGGIGGGVSGAVFLKHGAKALTRQVGKEWSHSIPKTLVNKYTRGSLRKTLNKRGGLNGSWVKPARHYRHDPSRWPSGWDKFGDRLPRSLQYLDRVPDWLKGSAAGGALGAAAAGNNDCACDGDPE
ncbi:MAG: RHS repeat-associated core domain-containing protein, partial [Parvularculaceae bacterium]